MKKRTKSFSKTFEWSPMADVFFKTWINVMDEKPKSYTIRAGRNVTISANAIINGNQCLIKRCLRGYNFNPCVIKRNPDGFLKALLAAVGDE